MSIARFFSPDLQSQVIELRGEEAHHLLNVRRLSLGQEVELFDGKGQKLRGKLSHVSKNSARIEVLTRDSAAPPAIEVTVACPIAKGPRWAWMLEKCTELGAAKIWPVLFQRSVVTGSGSEGQLDKWQRRCIEAAKQSGQAYLPRIAQPRTLGQVLRGENDAGLRLLGTVSESSQPILAVLDDLPRPDGIVLLVGPEGGLTDKEQALAEDSGCRTVLIGRNILRVETAAVAMLAAVRAWQDTRP